MSRLYWTITAKLCTMTVPHADKVFGLRNVGNWLESAINYGKLLNS